MTPEEQKRRYSWQCRRGLLEVDVVLNGYLDQHFLTDSEENRQRFEQLLACPDPDLFEWFTGRSLPDDSQLADYVTHILRLLDGPNPA